MQGSNDLRLEFTTALTLNTTGGEDDLRRPHAAVRSQR